MNSAEKRCEERFQKRREERARRQQEARQANVEVSSRKKKLPRVIEECDEDYMFSDEGIWLLNKITYDICKEKHFI